MSARFSKTEAAVIDAQRGHTDRSVWLRAVALAAIGRGNPQTETLSAPPVAFLQPEPVNDNAPPSAPCPHRLNPGTYCKTCGKNKT